MEGGPCGPLSFYSCQRGCHDPGCGLLLPQRPQNRVRKGAGSGGRSGDGLLQLPWTRDSPHTVLEAQKRQGCPGTRLLLPGWGPCPVLVTGLGPGVWASMSSLWSVLGSFRPQYCHDPSPFLFPFFSEQNKTTAPAHGCSPGHKGWHLPASTCGNLVWLPLLTDPAGCVYVNSTVPLENPVLWQPRLLVPFCSSIMQLCLPPGPSSMNVPHPRQPGGLHL